VNEKYRQLVYDFTQTQALNKDPMERKIKDGKETNNKLEYPLRKRGY